MPGVKTNKQLVGGYFFFLREIVCRRVPLKKKNPRTRILLTMKISIINTVRNDFENQLPLKKKTKVKNILLRDTRIQCL